MARRAYIGIARFEQRPLPSGYTQVEYIKTNTDTWMYSGSYIDTGVSAPQGFRFTGKISLDSINNNRYYYAILCSSKSLDAYYDEEEGLYPNHNGLYIFDNYESSDSDMAWCLGAGGDYYRYYSDIPRSVAYDIDFSNVVGSNCYLKLNGQTSASYTPYYSDRNSASLYLGACHTKDGDWEATNYLTRLTIYSCKIYVGGSLVRDYVPCKNSSGVAGLYDLVNNQFNSGSNSSYPLTAGPTFASLARRVKNIYIGINNKARRVKKAYIGIGGVARPFWPEIDITSYGTITGLTYPVNYLASTSIGNYALIGSGRSGTAYNDTLRSNINVYNSSLVKQSDINLGSAKDELCANTIGDYALFSGKGSLLGLLEGATIEAFNSSLSKVSSVTATGVLASHQASAKTGDYVLFGGGYNQNVSNVRNNGLSNVIAYNASLTKSSSSLTIGSAGEVAATSVGGYALFAGGLSGEGLSDNETVRDSVYAFNSSLTRSIKTSLASGGRYGMVAATVNGYALFAGGAGADSEGHPSGGNSTTVEGYDSSLTKLASVTSLSNGGYGMAATPIGDYILFAGSNSSIVDCYDKSLTRTSKLSLSSSRKWGTATTIGNYALFGGGYSNNSSQKTVDAFTII